jgi:hypothetical protein
MAGVDAFGVASRQPSVVLHMPSHDDVTVFAHDVAVQVVLVFRE